MDVVLFWAAMIAATGFLARHKNRSVSLWLTLSVFLAPITALILLVLPAR